jgi:hypothetical protein
MTAPTRAVHDVMVDIVAKLGARQPGVHVDEDSIRRP